MSTTKLSINESGPLRRSATISGICLTAIFLTLSVMLSPLMTSAVGSESMGDYFTISYDPAVFSDVNIVGSEAFSVTINGTATCIQNIPISEGVITGRIVARHTSGGNQVVLNNQYTLNISPFPRYAGDSIDMTVTVPLQFGTGNASGEYSIVAETTGAKVKSMGAWIDVTEYVPAGKVLGDIQYSLSTATPAPTSAPTVSPAPQPTIAPLLPISQMVLNIWDAGTSFVDMDAAGVLLQDIDIDSVGGDIKLHIPAGTKALDADGMPLTELMVRVESAPPATDEDYIIVAAFDFTPGGAVFTPDIELTISYDPDDLPAGFDETGLAVAYFDDDHGQWEFITPVNIDTDNHTATFLTGHFTVFAVLAPAGSSADTGSTTDVLPWIIAGGIFILGLALIALAIKRRRTPARGRGKSR